jgi:hypothetical protein
VLSARISDVNLSGIVSGSVGAINPNVLIDILHGDGTFVTQDDGTRAPAYQVFRGIRVQIQALTSDELRQVEGMNLQGDRQSVYLPAHWGGVVRVSAEAGDLLKIGRETWMVTSVMERWPDWTRLMVTLQNGS